MKHWLAGLLLLLSPAAYAQQAVPEIPFDSVPDLLKLPPNLYLGEVPGVAVNSKGHIFVHSRGGPLRRRDPQLAGSEAGPAS